MMDGYITVADVARLFPADSGKPTHSNTIANWITRGVRGVRLMAWRPGRRYYTTEAAVRQFLDDVRLLREDGISPSAGRDIKAPGRRRAVKPATVKRHDGLPQSGIKRLTKT